MNDLCSAVARVTVFAAMAVFTATTTVVAQRPAEEGNKGTTWQDLGFFQVPDGFSTDEIPLFEGLNEARGTWAFTAKVTEGAAEIARSGSLQVVGSPKRGMLPAWQLIWVWGKGNEESAIQYAVMASPKKDRFDLMMFRVGPVKRSAADQKKSKPRPTMFQGKWDLDSKTITWTKSDLPSRLAGPRGKPDDAHLADADPRESFEMVVAADGKISIRNSRHAAPGQLTSGETTLRTGKAPKEPVTLTGKHRFKTAREVADPRIQPTLPSQATDIDLLSTRGGHFARYHIQEEHLLKFLDKLWEAKKDSSAHQRHQMGGEGEPASRDSMVRRFQHAGWEPLANAITYYSPSKPNGAMTTYYYDRKAGIAYHDTGYW